MILILPPGLAGQSQTTYSLKDSADYFRFFLQLTNLSTQPLPGPVAFISCKEAPECPRIFQRVSSGPCLSQLSTIEAEAHSEKMTRLEEKWLGECGGYKDNPEAGSILKKNCPPPEIIKLSPENQHTAIWYHKNGQMTLTARCFKEDKSF